MIWKLISALTTNFLLFLGAPYALVYFEWMPIMTDKALVILLVTAMTVSIKTIFGDLISGEFLYHKHGYDFCITALGASMSGATLQVLSPSISLFPGLENAPFATFFEERLEAPVDRAYGYLILCFVLALFATLLTARISKAINSENPKYPDLLALINFMIGSCLLGFYVLLLITKGG